MFEKLLKFVFIQKRFIFKQTKMIIAPKIKLNNGYEIPALGLGTYESNSAEAIQAVKDAIDIGYRHIDCAYFYFNEVEVGKAVQEKINDGIVKREDLFITNKIWNTYHSKELVVPMCKKSLENFGMKYFDLYLIHWPMGFQEGGADLPKVDGKLQFSDVDYIETWKGMEECVKLGLTKSIGLSNFNSEQIERILSIAEIKPVTNQVECNPSINQKKLIEFCKNRDITITAYCPLGKPADTDGDALINNSLLGEIAKKYNKTSSQVILRYLFQIGTIPIPKSVNKERIKKNIDIFDFELTKDQLESIDSLDKMYRKYPYASIKDHKYYPFNIDF